MDKEVKNTAVKIPEEQYEAIVEFIDAFKKKFGFKVTIKSVVESAIKRDLIKKNKELKLGLEK